MESYAHEVMSALKWQVEAGAEEAIMDQPVNWLELEEEPRKKPASLLPGPAAIAPAATQQKTQKTPPPSSKSGAIADARKLADAADSLEVLKKAVIEFDGCPLKATAIQAVFADGNPEADVMAIGEAPGADEDRQGIPFCGVSGQLLDKMFDTIGLTRAESLYISNVIFWRPPGNRKPTPDEIEICLPFVEKHIALIKPKQLVLVGGTATTALLEESKGITRLRGKLFEYTNDYLKGEKIPVHVLFHPSYLLRQPAHKALAWRDLLQLRASL